MVYRKSIRVNLICIFLTVALFTNCGPRQIIESKSKTRGTNVTQTAPSSSNTSSQDIHFDDLLLNLQALAGQVDHQLAEGEMPSADQLEQLATLKSSLELENQKVVAHFAELDAMLADKEVSNEISQRQEQFAREYQEKYTTLMTRLVNIEQLKQGKSAQENVEAQLAEWQDTVIALDQFLAEQPLIIEQSSFDPNNLPHRSLRAEEPISPKLTEAEWQEWFVANVEQDKQEFLAKPRRGSVSENELYLQPTPEDLAETIEVQFTPEITQLAADLNNNPVEIYNWVHNNIEFVPTWGSILGAQLCLENLACNAFDTSSLLISLLRSSGIPARYQIGTINVPMDKAMNWLGGFTDPQAAARFVASAGVPSAGTVEQGGKINSLRMEHIWVKAFVDFVPSGGLVNNEGDTWIELDASFKQITYEIDLDLSALYPSLTNEIEASLETGLMDPSTGSLTLMNIELIEQALAGVEDPIVDLINSEYPDGAAQENVYPIGSIASLGFPQLPQYLPYSVLYKALEFSEIPDSLRHRVTFILENDLGDEEFNFSQSLPELSKRQIVLGFGASSEDDVLLLESLWSSVEQEPNTIPRAFPAQLIFVDSHLRIDGEIVATGSQSTLGLNKSLKVSFESPTIHTPTFISQVLAGETFVIGIDPQAISLNQFEEIMNRMNSTVNSYQAGAFEDIQMTSLTDDPLSIILLSYFGATDNFSLSTAASTGIASVRYPSAGTISIRYEKSSLFGSTLTVSPSNFVLDIGRDFFVTVSKDGNLEKEIEFVFMRGVMNSLYESAIPELGFPMNDISISETSGSTITYLAKANDQGIPIYLIDSSNISTILPLLQFDELEKIQIQNSINAGKQVVIPKHPLSTNNVFGKIVLDPLSGDAAFLIDGQANGWKRWCSQCQGLTGEAEIACLTGTAVYNPFGDTGCIGMTISAATAGIIAIIAGGAITLEALLTAYPGLGVNASLILAQLQANFANFSIAGGYRTLTYNAYKFLGSAKALHGLMSCSQEIAEFLSTGPPFSEPTAKIGQLMLGVLSLKGCVTGIKAALK